MTATYQPQSGDRLLPNAVGVTELGTAVGGVVAACGWAALRAVQKVVNPAGTDASPAGVTALTEEAVKSRNTVGKWAASGQATPSNIKLVAGMQGLTLMDISQDQAVQIAGIDPVEVGVSNARAFGGNDSNVSGHYITLLGKAANGDLIASDPNTNQSTQGALVRYTQKQLSDAKPFWFGTVEASGAGAGTPQGAGITLPGFPGPIWNPGVNIGQAVGSALDIPSAIGSAVNNVLASAALALKRGATFVFGLALFLLAVFTLFHGEEAVAHVKANGVRAAKLAAVAA
jgi:hypothetical protein